jgi:flagellin-like hook-associated protein FlgL
MVTILSNVSALAASRQLGVSKIGLNQAITRLTTGRRVNNAGDDEASLVKGNTAQANQRYAAAQVVTDQAAYFSALNADGANQQKTQDAYRMAELEGGGNTTTAEYTALKTATGATDSTSALSAIATSQDTNAGLMAAALSNSNLHGIQAETAQGIADAYLGADMGAEMANLTKYQILMQAGTSALNNANQSAQSVLGLFR